jgi:Ca2+-binding RTX toxin-like protein
VLCFLGLFAPLAAGATEVQFTHLPQVNGVRGYSISLAQLASRGRPDVIACKFFQLLVYPNRSDGTFGAPAKRPLPGECTKTAVGDLNGDGTPDVVVSTEAANSLLVFTGRHDGTLRDPSRYPLPGASLIATGDFNGDGNADVATAERESNQLTIFRGDGSARLIPEPSISIPDSSSDIAVADFNQDGIDDLAVVSWNSRSLKVVLGTKRGAPRPMPDEPLGLRPYSVAAGDLVGGPAPELITGANRHSAIRILRGNSAGDFSTVATLPVEGRAEDLALADMNRDGRLDVVAPNQWVVSTYFGRRRGGVTKPTMYTSGHLLEVGHFIEPDSIAIGNLNGDARPDFVIAAEWLKVFLQAKESHKCQGRTANLIGSQAADDMPVFSPRSLALTAQLGAGADLMGGSRSPDLVCLGRGADAASMHRGRDLVFAGSGDDDVHGMQGSDRIFGGSGDDVLGQQDPGSEPELGRDVLHGGAGDDVLRGGRGDDVLKGGPGRDECVGGAGHDIAIGCERR